MLAINNASRSEYSPVCCVRTVSHCEPYSNSHPILVSVTFGYFHFKWWLEFRTIKTFANANSPKRIDCSLSSYHPLDNLIFSFYFFLARSMVRCISLVDSTTVLMIACYVWQFVFASRNNNNTNTEERVSSISGNENRWEALVATSNSEKIYGTKDRENGLLSAIATANSKLEFPKDGKCVLKQKQQQRIKDGWRDARMGKNAQNQQQLQQP